MQAMFEAIRGWLGPHGAPDALHAEALLKADATPERSYTHAQASSQAISDSVSDAIILDETFESDGKSTAIQVRADKLILRDEATDASRIVRLNDSLEHYHGLDFDIRLQLGRRIARMLPELAHAQHEQLLNHTASVIRTIAQDQSERVRMMLAEELAEQPDAPYDVVQLLAHDTSARVASPILEYSTLLGDRELMEILSTCSMPSVAEAIAKRTQISASVSGAIVATNHPQAISLLLENKGAQIDGASMELIIDMAPKHEEWHGALVARPEITQKTIARLSGFIAQDILMKLEDSGKVSRWQKRDARVAVQHRLNSWSEEQLRQAEMQVRQLHAAGKLDDELIDTAINTPNEAFVVAALSARARMTTAKVKKILRSESPSAMTALAWEAALPMRSAYALQLKIGRVHHTKLIHPRGGTDYPLAESEMETYLEIFSG
jgi:uncharacterized protein (DUF2336 family)